MAHQIRSRRPSGLVVRSGPKRTTTWFGFNPTVQALTAAGGTIIFSLNAAALALQPFTVVRSLFELYITSDQEAASEDQLAGFGIAVVSDEATAAGVTAIPTPITEMASDLWFAHQLLFNSTTANPVSNVGTRYMVDSRAMRKVSIGQDIVVVLEFDASGGGSNVIIGGRMLVKNN